MSALDALFDKWIETYPENLRDGFHRDGIINESLYWKQAQRILFVLLEPNSKGGNYDRFYGADLRRVFQIPMAKEINKNLGLWTRYLVDGVEVFEKLGPTEAREHLLQVAVLNLKKIAGSGTADYTSISQYAWQDRKQIREEVSLIGPTLIVTCGTPANRLFAQLAHDDLQAAPPEDRVWRWGSTEVLPSNHPSLRPRFAEAAFKRLIERHKGASSAPGGRVNPRPRPPKAVASSGGWVLRPYPHNIYRLTEFLQGNSVALGWPDIGDLGRYDRNSLIARLREVHRDRPGHWYGRSAGTLLRFRDQIQIGDIIVVAPMVADSDKVAISRVTGPYRYVARLDGGSEGYPHHRSVEWLDSGLNRGDLPEEIVASLVQGTLHRANGSVLRRFCRRFER